MLYRGALLAVLLAGCGGSEDPLPVACRADGDTYERALQAAPDVVRLEGTTLAQCIRESSSDAELVAIGATLTTLGEQLELRAAEGDRRAAVQLGYLVGAAERAARDTSGIHTELAYRLERSAAAVTDAPGGAETDLRRGIAAGSALG